MRKTAYERLLCPIVFMTMLAAPHSNILARTPGSNQSSASQSSAIATPVTGRRRRHLSPLDWMTQTPSSASALPRKGAIAPPHTPGVSSTPPLTPCAGPAVCGQTCNLDAYGTPIICVNGQCSCAPGYELQGGAGDPVCQPVQPEVIGTESDEYDCPGICSAATPWQTPGSIYKAFDLVPVHGIAPGGEAFMPVWGYQATYCGDHGLLTRACRGGANDGLSCAAAADCPDGTCALSMSCEGGPNNGLPCAAAAGCPAGICAPSQTWAGCAPDPFPFCFGLQESDEGDFDFDNCEPSEGCGSCGDVDCSDWAASRTSPAGDTNACNVCGTCVSDFTDAWPYIDNSVTCSLGTTPNPIHHIGGVSDPARIDFPNNVSVYRAPIRWEDFSDFWDNPIDDDYTWDMESPGHELFDTDDQFAYHTTGDSCHDGTHGRVHVEFSSDETVDNFTDDDWGPANEFWRLLRCTADDNFCNIGVFGDNAVRCFVKQHVNDGLVCPPAADHDIDADCNLHDPMGVVVGIPSLDCADNAYEGTDEIHPVLAMAIRIHEDLTTGPEKWAFFYRQHGNTGPCGNVQYSRCLSNFVLPLGLPIVPPDKVLTGADVHVDWHPWADRFIGDPSPDIAVTKSFDLSNGTVLNVHLPHNYDGVVGEVTVTPQFDTQAPTIACPGNVTTTVDLGKCTAAVSIAPTVSDNCSVTSTCAPASGSAFPIGTTTDTCTAIDQAGLPASCTFSVTVTAGNKCPQALGYWKRHTGVWAVNQLTLGRMPYTSAQLIGILNNPSTRDASVILAKSLIATLLDLASGSSPVPVCNLIADANDALGSCNTIPCGIAPSSALGQRMIADANTLDRYDSGALTAGCAP